MTPLEAFSPDYKTARARFRNAIADQGWAHEAHAVLAPGFADGELSIDVASIGPVNADRLLILSSGMHGGEAFFGSAVQLAWLASLPSSWAPPAGCAIRLIHALNPFGFAMLRRANEDNVDLNRNFLANNDFAALRELTALEYGLLDRYLNPPRPPSRIDWFPLIFPWMALKFGFPFLRFVMPAGQYSFPKGIFFGGDRHCRTTEVVMNESPRWVGSAQQIFHLDFHTGLGRYGDYHLLASDPPGSERVKLALGYFGKDRVKIDGEVPDGYHNHGDMGEWLSQRFADRNYLYLCAEFGTYNSTRVIGALRRENQAHFFCSPGSPAYQRSKRDLFAAFTPLSPAWRWSAVHRSLELIRTAITVCTI
jgi:Protein of unknown function (DUF2817)